MRVPLFETVHARPSSVNPYPGWLGYNALSFFTLGSSFGALIDVPRIADPPRPNLYVYAKYVADDEYLLTVAGFYTFFVILPVRLDELAMTLSIGFDIFVTEKNLFNLFMKAKYLEENPF